MPHRIQIHPADTVAIVADDGGLSAGTQFADGLTLKERVPQGHKVALKDHAAGDPVVRYGVCIGRTQEAIAQGSWVHERLLEMPEALALDHLPMATRSGQESSGGTAAAPVPEWLRTASFQGYRNPDGSVGTRNLLALTQTVQCVSGLARIAADRIRTELLPHYPHVDGVVALEHSYGCGVAIEAPGAEIPIRTLRNLALHPNFGGQVLVISLGCEKLQPERLVPQGVIPIAVQPVVVTLQDPAHVGFQSMVQTVVDQARTHLERLNARRRETVPASALVVGVQCGGSDAFSGVTANPAVGACTDLLVQAGATVMFSETTEVRDAVDQLTARAQSPEVAQRILEEMAWYDAYLARGSVDRSANTTPGNKQGGLSNIVEKAMGSIIKSGTAPITGVLRPGERLPTPSSGLYYAATPASDFICGTLQLAAGMNVHIFTTGRGTPYGLAEVPVVKVGTRTELARRWHDLIDVNAGRIADGDCSVEDLGRELFEHLLAVASGQATWAERWKLHNALVLFNPAPVT